MTNKDMLGNKIKAVRPIKPIIHNDNPYDLQGLPTAIQFSGGRTSGFMLYKLLEYYGGKLPDNCYVLFQNTGREMEETLEFVKDCSEKWDVKIHWLEYVAQAKNRVTEIKIVDFDTAARNGEPFDKLMDDVKRVPNVVSRICTFYMKVRTAHYFMRKIKQHDNFQKMLGLRFDEKKRAQSVTQNAENFETPLLPLYHSRISKHHITEFWQSRNFDLGLKDINGVTPLGNCDGCFLKSEKSKLHLARHYPERFDWWTQQEKKRGRTFRLGESYQKNANFIADQQELGLDDFMIAHACDVESGECFG